MTAALVLIVAGLTIGFGAFGFAAVNMCRGVTSTEPFSGFGRMFKGHIGAMVAMAFGGLMFVIGLVLVAVHVLSR